MSAAQGPDLILIHGASGNARDMTWRLRPIWTRSYRVIAFDRPGLGWSDPIPDQSLRGQALHLSAAASATRRPKPDPRRPKLWRLGQPRLGAATRPLKPRALVLISAPSLPWPGPLRHLLPPDRQPDRRGADPAACRRLRAGQLCCIRPSPAFSHPIRCPPAMLAPSPPTLTLRRAALRANFAQVNGLRAEIVAQEPFYPQLTLPIEMIHGTRRHHRAAADPLGTLRGPLAQCASDRASGRRPHAALQPPAPRPGRHRTRRLPHCAQPRNRHSGAKRQAGGNHGPAL